MSDEKKPIEFQRHKVNDCPICGQTPRMESLAWGFVISHRCRGSEAFAYLETNDEDLVKVVKTWNKWTEA